MLFAADFIGTSGETRVTEFSLPGQGATAEVVAYGAYDDGRLSRIAAINYADATSLSFDLGADSGVTQVELRRLINYSPQSDLNFNQHYGDPQDKYQCTITWGELTWNSTTNGLGVKASDDTISMKVENGIVEMDLEQNTAFMAFLTY